MEYLKASQVAEILQIDIKRVRLRLKQMKPYIGTEYPEDAMLMDDGTTRVKLSAYVDFCNRRKDLE